MKKLPISELVKSLRLQLDKAEVEIKRLKSGQILLEQERDWLKEENERLKNGRT